MPEQKSGQKNVRQKNAGTEIQAEKCETEK
jgi:hypothetical protein